MWSIFVSDERDEPLKESCVVDIGLVCMYVVRKDSVAWAVNDG